ncbi:MAG: hypothetical protein ACOY4D_03635 [Pseudomonadota bacterium]
MRRSGNGAGRFVKIAALIALPVVVIVIGAAVMRAALKEPRMGSDYCTASSTPRHNAAAFIDVSFTTDTSAPQDRDLTRALHEAYDTLPANGRLSIFTTANATVGSLPVPVLSVCRPPANEPEQAALGLGSKPAPYLAHQAEEARKAFAASVAALLAQAKDREQIAKDSPILEQVQGISRFRFDGPMKSLTVYTDGLQNSESFQFCQSPGHMPPIALFTQKPAYRFVKPDSFEGVAVHVLLVEFGTLPSKLLPYCTSDEVRRFWPDYFKTNGAASVQLTRLRYGAM